MSRKKTHEEFVREIEEKYPNQFILLSDYNGRENRINVKCKKCGREWSPRAKDLLNGYGCRVCKARLTHEQFMEKFNMQNDKNIEILSEYVCSSEPIMVRCLECSYEWDTKPESLLSNHGCPRCGKSLKKTTRIFYDEVNEKFPGRYTILSEYVNCNKKITIKCNVCNYTWDITPSSLLYNGGCPNCFKLNQSNIMRNAKLNPENCFANGDEVLIKEWQYCVQFPLLKPQDFSCGSNLLCHWKCSVCGYEWETSVNNRTNGHNCPSCTNKKKRSHTEFLDEIIDMLGKIEVLEEYQSADKPIKVRCLDCGNEWSPVARSLLNGHGCKICAMSYQTSNLQKLVEEYIKDKYDQEPLHENMCTLKCYNPKTGRLLPFDNEIKIYDKKLIIEVHGIQHYETNGLVKMSAERLGISEHELFEYNRWKDEYKKRFVIENGYEYLEIPYWTEKDKTYIELIENKIKEIYLKKGNG